MRCDMCEVEFHSYHIHGELTICVSEASYTPEQFINLCRRCTIKVVAFIGLDYFTQRQGHAVMQTPPVPQSPTMEEVMRGRPSERPSELGSAEDDAVPEPDTEGD